MAATDVLNERVPAIACRTFDAKGRIQPFERRNRVHVVNIRMT
jgi:hypothetical protein